MSVAPVFEKQIHRRHVVDGIAAYRDLMSQIVFLDRHRAKNVPTRLQTPDVGSLLCSFLSRHSFTGLPLLEAGPYI